ncbi:unnamed protein product, partial [Notodromas monacha]
KNGKSVLVSLWVRLLNGAEGADENVAVAVAEPVIRADAVLQLGAEGKIVWFDPVAREIFDLSEDHLNEMDATTLLPKLSISSEMPSDLDCSLNHQSLVARGVDGLGTFPVTVTTFESSDLATMCEMAAPQAEEFLPADFDFERGTHVVVVSIYGNLSGLVLVDEDGKIVDVNPSFALLTFGWNRAAVVGQSVKVMLPTFYRDCEVDESDSMPLPPMDDMKIPLESTPKAGRQRPESGIGRDEDRRFVDGTYSGTGLHSDGSKINVVYHVQFAKGNNNMEGSESTKDVYCVWISTATEISSAGLSESMRKVRGLNSSSLNASIANTTTESTRNQLNFGHYLLSARKQRWSAAATEEDYNETEGDTAKLKMWDNNDLNDESFGDDKDLVAGAYSKRYSVLESIGKGAFGCVKLASRIGSDSEEVFVTKFITKSQVHPSCRVQVGDVKQKLGLKALDSTWVPAEFAKGNNNMEGSESTKDVYCVWISTATEISSAGLSESMRKVRGLNSSSLNASIANTTTESTRNQLNFGHYLLSARKQRWSAAATEEDYNETEGDTAKLKMWDNNDLNDESFGDDKDLVAGAYSKRYSVLESIGKGAFGCVKLASRIGSDSEEVFVTKFITKSQVHPSCRVQVGDVKQKLGLKALDSTWVPAEVDFLLALNHTNIVKAVEVFCNEKYFQLVMRRHGKCIIDLFDFIERRRPEQMPEDLAHHIFVQIADALRYLHEEEKIVHRDIKDENIILNERFDAQLIDFGSAAYLPSEKKGSRKGSSSLFYTFCGTYQYCSPEVILGNAYRGPELELWSLGVTLYTMMYKDNPFSSRLL